MRERALDELVARVAARLSGCGVVPLADRRRGSGGARGVCFYPRHLLVADPGALEPGIWDGVLPEGFDLQIRRRDEQDPLRGVVRVDEQIPDDADCEFVPGGLDLVIVRGGWADLIKEVDARVGLLPRSCVRMWRRIEDGLSFAPP